MCAALEQLFTFSYLCLSRQRTKMQVHMMDDTKWRLLFCYTSHFQPTLSNVINMYTFLPNFVNLWTKTCRIIPENAQKYFYVIFDTSMIAAVSKKYTHQNVKQYPLSQLFRSAIRLEQQSVKPLVISVIRLSNSLTNYVAWSKKLLRVCIWEN
jgi:hypothetical protein